MSYENKIEEVKSFPELNEDLPLQITGWKVQKVCWLVLLALLLLIALGLFGNGPFSYVKTTADNTTLEYERFSRPDRELDIALQLRKTKGKATVMIPMSYLAHFKLDKIFPETYKSKIKNGSILYSFDTGEQDAFTIHFYLYPKKRGAIEGRWMVDHRPFRLSHFIYP